MLETILALIALFGAIGIIIFKLWSIFKTFERKPFLEYKSIFITLVIMLFFWLLFFIAFAGALGGVQTLTSAYGEVFTYTTSEYETLAFIFPVMNFFVELTILLTTIEALGLFAHRTKRT